MKRLLTTAIAALSFATAGGAFAEDAYIYSTEVSAGGADGSSVNIGYCMKATSRIEVDFQYPEAPTKDVLFGAWGVPGSDATPGLRTTFWNNNGYYSFILDSGAFKSYSSPVALDAARHTAVIDAPNRAFRLLASDGSSEWSGSVDSDRTVSGESNWPVVLFGCAKNARGAGNQHTKARIYSVKIFETENGAETLVRDLVPCRKGDRVGFYDLAGGVFYGGQGNLGGLVCGGDGVLTLQEDGYLETPSTNKSSQKISFNTGYCMKHYSRIEVDFQWLGTPADLLFGAWDDGAVLRSGFWINSSEFSFLLGEGTFKSYSSGIPRNNYRHTAVIDAKNKGFSLLQESGLVEYGGSSVAECASEAAWPVVLFGAANSSAGDGKQWSYARIFSVRIFENDGLVKDFEPYVKDGASGFMEKVGGEFSAIGGITAGGNVESDRCSYIENNGMTALNLGYLASMKSRIEVDYRSLNDAAGKVVFGSWAAGSLRYAVWSDSKDNKVKFIFHGKSSNDPQYVTSSAHDNERHKAVVDMKNQMMYYTTGSATNYAGQATAGTFNATDASTIPLCVFGYINGSGTASMQAKARVYSVRIYEDEELVREFLPYTDGTTVSLRDAVTGHVATKVVSSSAEPAIGGVGVDGAERWLVAPQSVSVVKSQSVTLKALAVGAVSYRWTRNGAAVAGGADGELEVSWRKARTPDVYAVTPVYRAAVGEIEGEAVAATVENVPQGMAIIVK
ncbi:MAG: hypothetical protein IKE55_06495 [Kiritimatiellae bacterium]|nr:hypothetical protein [Kiritimatiellia bacterium]